jgi:hypothetical protein
MANEAVDWEVLERGPEGVVRIDGGGMRNEKLTPVSNARLLQSVVYVGDVVVIAMVDYTTQVAHHSSA